MKKLFTFIYAFSLIHSAYASHLLGGEIRTRRLTPQGLTYEIRVLLYGDEFTGSLANDGQNNVTVCVGEGKQTITVTRQTRITIAPGVSLNSYSTQYTYAAPGTFTVSVTIENRGGDITNFNAVNTAFYIQTTFATNIINSTPAFDAPIGVQTGALKQIFNYNANATDTDGDSLVYRLGVSTQGVSANCTYKGISDFKYPNEITNEGTFRINPATGNLTWNAPTQVGTYTFVVMVEEWRNGVRISETQREVTVRVEDKGGDNVVIPPFEYVTNGVLTAIEKTPLDVLTIFPSPARNRVNATLQSTKATKALFQLIDSNGKIVDEHLETEPVFVHTHDFEVKNLPSGVYFIRTITEKPVTKKFVKE